MCILAMSFQSLVVVIEHHGVGRSGSIPSDDRAGRCDDENFMTYQLGSSTTDEPFQNTTQLPPTLPSNGKQMARLTALFPTMRRIW